MNILDICRGMRKKIGEVGIEIEVEGDNLPISPMGWDRVNDGSLRGESGEYVLTSPVVRKSVKKFLKRMTDANKESGFKFKFSNRQSIHIHINVQEMGLTQVYNFITLFLLFEQHLVKFCGVEREGNLFCLRSGDAEGLIEALEEASSPATINRLNTDDIRYSAMNVSSLFKYGSLEFRSMRGTDDYTLIEKWIEILLSLKDAALTFKSPRSIVEQFSRVGVTHFTEQVLGKHSTVVTSDPSYESVLYHQMRRLQILSYTGDWKGLDGPIKERPIHVNLGFEDAVRAGDAVVRPRMGNVLMQPIGFVDDEEEDDEHEGQYWDEEMEEWIDE